MMGSPPNRLTRMGARNRSTACLARPLASLVGPESAGYTSQHAGIAQLVEHNLAKVGVAGSSPVSRSAMRIDDETGAVVAAPVSISDDHALSCTWRLAMIIRDVVGRQPRAGVAKSVDARDLKSCGGNPIRVRVPVPASTRIVRYPVARPAALGRTSRAGAIRSNPLA